MVGNKPHKLHLEEEKETLLITLYAKALDSQAKVSLLNDQKAAEIMNSIDYNFEKLNSFGNGNLMVVRAKQLDTWLQEFLKNCHEAIVLNLGCGLVRKVSKKQQVLNTNGLWMIFTTLTG